MIGLIDVNIQYGDNVERVTLPFYRSSGTNNGKMRGLWYPIVGIKTHDGPFTEFTNFINAALTATTGYAKEGWLAKSLFFQDNYVPKTRVRGFSNGKHYDALFETGKILRYLYENGSYYDMYYLTPQVLNEIISSNEIYPGNTHTQRRNFDKLIYDIVKGL